MLFYLFILGEGIGDYFSKILQKVKKGTDLGFILTKTLNKISTIVYDCF